MTVEEMQKGVQEVWQLFKETDLKFKETDQKFQMLETSLDKKIEALIGTWGKFVEGLVAPGTVKLFRERGIEVTGVSQRVKRQKNGDGMEIDVLAINGEYAILIEVKSTLGVEDVREHLDRLGKFATFFPEYRERKILGAVAGIDIQENADRFAYQQGLFVITQSGDTVKILNDEKFRPKVW